MVNHWHKLARLIRFPLSLATRKGSQLNSRSSRIAWLLAVGPALNLFGCVVGQPPGNGQLLYLTEAKTGNGYYLYLPEDYVQSEGVRPPGKKWPIVVSFHGMRPFDSAGAQVREWQQEADRYGFVILAPDTRISDLLGELPLNRVSPSLKRDEEGVLAILDELYEKLDVDPNHVLTTSWSMGGYLAHYMINRHPDRFSCLAVRQSNFSADILDTDQVPKYRDSKVAIFYTQNDFGIVRRESQQAIAWYAQHGFDTTSGIVEGMGHERTPQTAAAFFAKTCGAEAKTPPMELSRIRLTPVPAARIASAAETLRKNTHVQRPPQQSAHSGTGNATRALPSSTPSRQLAEARTPNLKARPAAARNRPSSATPERNNRNTPALKKTPVMTRSTLNRPIPARPLRVQKPTPTPKRTTRSDPKRKVADLQPLGIRLSAHIGISPMPMSYTVQIPPAMRKGADILWIDNGEPMSRGISGQKILIEPGQHKVEVLVVTKDNREYRASKTVTVLERLSLDDDDNG